MAASEDLRDYLVNQGLTGVVQVGTLSPDPDALVTTLATGGMPPVITMGGGSGSVQFRIIFVQILARGLRDGYEVVYATMETIYAIVANAINVTVNSNTYGKIVAVSEPAQLLVDENERPVLSMNVEMWKAGV